MTRLIPSLPLSCNDLTYACVTASDEYGYGVFSWHNNPGDAEHNARVTGGWCVPVHCIDNRYWVPAAGRILDQVEGRKRAKQNRMHGVRRWSWGHLRVVR